MHAIFSKKNDVRMRESILREVYEENLRILGKKNDRLPSKPKPFFLRRAFLWLILPMLAIVFYENFATTTDLPDTGVNRTAAVVPETRMSQAPQEPEAVRTPGPNKPAEYSQMLGSGQVHLSRVFGLGVKTIMIDAGHGGADSGTVGKLGTKEKDLTLDIAKRLKARLEKSGRYHVVMTREGDIAVPLHQRVQMAAASRADLFISVHLNYLPSRPINMIETYYFGPSKDPKTLKLAEQENAGSQYGLSDFKEIIGKIGETFRLQESKAFATSIQRNLYLNIKKENGVAYDFGVKRAPFVVLLGVEVPAVLAEVSCLSNTDEEKNMNTEVHRENIAHYLEAGILDYLKKGEMNYEARRAEK